MAAYVDVEKPNRDIRRMAERLEKLPLDDVSDLTFEGRDVWLDGRRWVRCTFRHCRVFMLLGAWETRECHFDRCEMSFVSSALKVAEMARRLPDVPPS